MVALIWPFACLLLVLSTCDVILAETTENNEEERTGTIIGIDLGTTYSCVGVFQKGQVEIIANDQGNRITPSYVAFGKDQRLVGDAAKNQATVNPENTVFDVKRLIGRKYSDSSVQADKKLLPYEIVSKQEKPFIEITTSNKNDDDTTSVNKAIFAPEEISAMVLAKLKQTAEAYLGKTIERAVVTVPAYFNDAQRHATKDAGTIAGLHVERIMNEPTAAAMAYGMLKEGTHGEEHNILVFDLGGGTFDVTVLTIDEGIFQVLSTNGDTHLGGSDFDQSVMNYYLDQISKKTGVDVRKNPTALQKLRQEVERVKRALSSQMRASLEIDDLVPNYDFSETLTRAKFEELNHALFQKTLKPVKLALEDAGLEQDEITEIILVGGSTRIPKIQQLLSDYFGGKELHKGVNPDEAVAHGAAVQGSILSGEGGEAVKDIMLLDVTPLSLGTSVEGGLMSVLIPRGTAIPTEKSGSYVTLKDNQSHMNIDVYEGERSMVKDNHLLGDFDMTNIPPAPRGQISIDVTFRLDANGILEVTAENRSTKTKKQITITPETGRLSQDDIDRMVQEAELYAEEDKRTRERVEAKNQLESYAYKISSTLQDLDAEKKDLISPDERKELMDSVDETLEWLEEDELREKEDFDEKYNELKTLAGPLMSKLYNSDSSSDGEDDGFDDEL
mmetsp:Transcript_17035/g.25787  ORF Transcript_17035/g.25787 Transcript_17035/m.25787 type:complete len:673 (+) Transcript_17035:163-2181(+)